MKKEIAIAIVIGLLLGLVVTFGIYVARTASQPSTQDSADILASSSPEVNTNSTLSTKNSSLAISSPVDGTITNSKDVQVSGTTQPNSFMFVFYGTEYKTERADGTGNFSTKITLKNGSSLITVRALDPNGTVSEENVAIFIGDPDDISKTASSSATASPSPKVVAKATAAPKASTSAKKAASPSPSPVATASADDQATENLKQRIDRVLDQRQEKLRELEAAGQERRLFIGEVQRIIEQTVTLKTPLGNQTFTITPDIALIRDGKKATADDFAVGDWVGVIGLLDKETIQAQHIFASSTSLEPTKQATLLGTVKEITRTQVKFTEGDGTEHALTLTKTVYQDEAGTVIKREQVLKDKKILVIAKSDVDQTPATMIVLVND